MTALVAVFFVFQAPLENLWKEVSNKYTPCAQPIEYSLGTFDSKFGISKEDFLEAVKKAEDIWETSSGKDLFSYNPKGELKINLIYDTRQAITINLQKMGITVGNDKASYDKLKSKYNALTNEYQKQKTALEKEITSFENRQDAYEKEVIKWNEQGGAPEEDYARLSEEKIALSQMVVDINALEDDVNKKADTINSLAVAINKLVSTLNINVAKLNTIGEQIDGEFEEGTYQSGPDGAEIDIFQFDNQNKLIRVLAHEFGHAMGLGHVDDKKAIMYRLNNGVNEALTDTDLTALKVYCGLE